MKLIALIEFDPTLGWWSPAVFWYVLVSVFICLLFCAVVFIGGLFDLRFLLQSLDEERVDATDDGRVETSAADRKSESRR